MSYDLYFEAGPGKTLDKKSFASYFRARPNYQVGNGQALYQNEDTGIYFIFDEPEDGVVAFNLNLFRPHVFGMEAAPELEQFARTFAATVTDPQGGMEGTFSKQIFFRGWVEANKFAYRSMMKDQTGPVPTWPAKRIREVWEWNYGLAKQREKEESIFAPTIFAIDVNGEARSVVIWPPDCAILMPAVDMVMVPLAQSGNDSEELALVKWEELSALVRPYQEKVSGIARYRLAFKEWPSALAGFLDKKRKPVGKMKGIGMDEILDREMVQEANAAGRR